MTVNEIRQRLMELQDLKYRDFQCKLMPGVDTDKVIGVRTPELRKLAKEIYRSGEYREFLDAFPHEYYDERNLHGFIISEIKDYEECLAEIDRFLPCVDNWATCDLVSPKVFKKNPDKLISEIRRWMDSTETYTIRFGMEMLMSHYLDDNFKPEYLDWVVAVKSEEYYVNMMIAWFMATTLAKQWDATVPYIEKHVMDDWCHKKTIQKARESYRITPEQKEYLKGLKG